MRSGLKGPRHYIFGAAFRGVRQNQRTDRCCMAKAKKTKPREHLIRWRVSLITATPAKFVEAHDIGDALRNHLVAIRADL